MMASQIAQTQRNSLRTKTGPVTQKINHLTTEDTESTEKNKDDLFFVISVV
jgi:hypothetical protein